jgi:hypothetical protein
VAKKLTAAEMHRLARLGAAAKLAQLEREIAALKRAFPGLKPKRGTGFAPPPEEREASGAPDSPVPPRDRRAPMSVAERKTVSDRMKRYWGARRKGGSR